MTSQKSVVFSTLIGCILLVGCTTHRQQAAHVRTETTIPPVVVIAPTPSTLTLGPAFDANEYQSNPLRNAPILTALDSYGKAVLPAIIKGHWGRSDGYCGQSNDFSVSNHTSTGYTPKPGDDCSVQHSPDYGGSSDLIMASVIVGSNGKYSNTFIGAGIITPSCSVSVDVDMTAVPYTIFVSGDRTIDNSDTATTPAAAKALDNRVIACLNQTRP